MEPAHCPLLNTSINFSVTFFHILQLYKIELLAMQIHNICICGSTGPNKSIISLRIWYI